MEPKRGLIAVTHRVPPMPVRKLSGIANLLHVLYLKYGYEIHVTTRKARKLPIYRITCLSQMGNTGQVVDVPNFVVSAFLPLDIFVG